MLKARGSNETGQTRFHEQNLRFFFGRFLIVPLAPNSDMDDYLGFTPPEAQHSLMAFLKPKIDGHFLRGV
jgi:hypothetical protein